ncbi:MAG: PfkB family carbohydrate kinase, partial [Acidimicrobiales bacterium]
TWRCDAASIQVVDPSGAGDAFAAGVISGALHGLDVPQTLQLASVLGRLRDTRNRHDARRFHGARGRRVSKKQRAESQRRQVMNYEMKMPDLATTGGDVTVVRWLASEGESVKRGQPILEVETDKAVMEVESVTDGVLQQIIAQDGEQIGAGELLARLETTGGAANCATSASTTSENASGENQTSDVPSPIETAMTTGANAATLPPRETARATSAPPTDTPASTRGTSMFARNRQRA